MNIFKVEACAPFCSISPETLFLTIYYVGGLLMLLLAMCVVCAVVEHRDSTRHIREWKKAGRPQAVRIARKEVSRG